MSQPLESPNSAPPCCRSFGLAAALMGLLICMLVLLASCTSAGAPQAHQAHRPPEETAQPAAPPALLFTVPDSALKHPLRFIIYGDMRFTDPAERKATAPGPRLALVLKIAAESPDAVVLTGDIPWHGKPQDYAEYDKETAIWRERHLRIYPVLGNHEFQLCPEATCLAAWWQTFPELRGHRWYAVALGTRVRILALDSNLPLRPGSEQRQWLEQQLQALPPAVRFVILALHHPPVADQGMLIVRRNEASLVPYLRSIAPRLTARIIVAAAHVHNYERFEKNGILYLVSGGGGAKPLWVYHSGADFYHQGTYPNFHYILFTLDGPHLRAQMVRLEDYAAPTPHTWKVRDRFEVLAREP